MKKLTIKIISTTIALSPAIALAQFDPVGDGAIPETPTPVTNFGELMSVISTISGVMFAVLMALGAVFVLWSAFQYLISQGDDTKITSARKALTYAIVALVVGALSGGISLLVQNLL